jgi:hypothetical protein
MKKQIALAIAVAGISASATVALAGAGPGTGINGSKHDINAVVGTGGGGYQGDNLGRTCVFCHTPHNAMNQTTLNADGSVNAIADAPLWNHKNSTVNLKAYAWVAPTNKAIGITDPLIGPSRLCMACHDGVTAVDAHGSANGNIANGGVWDPATADAVGKMTSSYTDALGNTAKRYITDLQVTHPIGFVYEEAVTARPRELEPSASGYLTAAPYGTAAASFDTHTRLDASNTAIGLSSKKIKDTLYGNNNTTGNSNGYMTCATCHDVHNSVNVGVWVNGSTKGDYNYFLYAPEAGSAICLSCHIK